MGRSVGRSRLRKGKSKNKKTMKKTTKRNRAIKGTSKPIGLRLLDLNDHCLIKIFELLSVYDLVNLAVANRRFHSSTSILFTKNFAKNVIGINNAVTAYHMPSVMLLRSFGHLINKLKVHYKEDYNRFNDQFEHAIIKYCTKTVTEIEFLNADRFAFNQIEKKFKAATKVVFTSCVIGGFISEFNKWFPNTQSVEFLELTILAATDVKCIERCCPKLVHLGVINRPEPDEEYEDSSSHSFSQPIFSNVNVLEAIRLNPQLKSLKLKLNNNNVEHHGIKITNSLLAYINEKLPLLAKLHLFIPQIEDDEYDEPILLQRVHFENLQNIKIVVACADALKHYDISTAKPAEITLIASVALNESCAAFLLKNKMWAKMAFYGHWQSYQSYESLKIHLVKFPLLNTIKISVNGPLKGKERQILALLIECKFLKKLKVCYSTVPWHNLTDAVVYDLDPEDKRRAELRFLDSAKFLNDWQSSRADPMYDDAVYWMQNVSGIDSDTASESDTGSGLQRIKKVLPTILEKRGKSMLKMFEKAFEDRRFRLWQSTYHKQGHFFLATFEKKDNVEMSV